MTGFHWPVRVYYEDTDAGGVVYYANYLKYMERARTEWLRSFGYEQDELIEHEQVIFVVRHIELDLRRPARFNDQILIGAEIVESGHASVTFEQVILREGEEGLPLCVGRARIACVDSKTFRPKRFPKALLPDDS